MTTYPIINDPNDYGAVFHKNILRSLQALLTQVEAETGPGLSATLRTRVEAAFDYAFAAPAGWPLLRQLLRLLTPKFNLAGGWTAWAPHLEKGLAASVVRGDEATRAVLLADLGLMNQRLSRLVEADAQLREAAALARAQGDGALLGLALQRCAEVARLERRYADCTALLAEASTLSPPDATAQAYGLFIAGKAAFDQHDLAAATAAFTQAITLWEAAGNSGGAALCMQNLGRIATAQGESLAAIPLYEKALALLTSAGDLSNIPVVQINLGNTYYTLQQYEQALKLYTEAETQFLAMNDDRYLAMVYNNFGVIRTVFKEWDEAKTSLERSIRLYQQLGDNKAWISAKGNLAIAYSEQTDYAQAIKIFEEALDELQTTSHDPHYEWLHQELTKHLTQAQKLHQDQKK